MSTMFERYPDLELQLHLSNFENVDNIPASPAPLKLPLDKLDVIYSYGLSDGHDFLHLEEWLEAVSGKHLIFLEDDLSAVHRVSQLPWGEKLFKHPQVHLKFLNHPIDWVLELCAREFPSERIEIITRKKKNSTFRALQLALLRKTVLWNSLTSEQLSGHILHRNIFTNFQQLPKSFNVNQMKNAFQGKAAIICGAGPSLAGVIEDLKYVKDNALIIGCGSALSALSHFNLKPHFGIAIDPNRREKECLQGCQFRDLPLIYGNRLYPEVFELFDGPFGYLRSPTGSLLEKNIEEQLGLMEGDIGLDLGREALSVTTLALALACHWGCSPIILAGVDLAYAGNSHYAQGVPVHAMLQTEETRAGEQLIYRKGAEGTKVATLIKWVMEQETIDAYTKLYPDRTFYNATGKGLGFPSIPHIPLREIPLTPLNLDLNAILASYSLPVTRDQLQITLSGVKASFQTCWELSKQLQQESEESGRAILFEEDLREEIVYPLTIRPALEALERVYRLNIDIPFSQHKWKFLQEMIEEYLKLL